ncbi:MAG: chorismate synthase, partial [Lentimicrobiaceae bacterium]|nr:chorismate synthase [Lentimicrobiaceae bacterium]
PFPKNRRKEDDAAEFLSGVLDGKTTGMPIAFVIANNDVRSEDYLQECQALKPSHADYVYRRKYGLFDHRGGGRASARETASWVAAGCFAMMWLKRYAVHIEAYTTQIGNVKWEHSLEEIGDTVAENSLHCPDSLLAKQMLEELEQTMKNKDSVGCKVGCVVKNVPIGLGEPVFDKLSAHLAKAIMSIPAAKGFEYGLGFEAAAKHGSEVNDILLPNFHTKTNFSGGIQAGISNGETIYFSAAFKPIPSILQDQPSVNMHGEPCVLQGKGRHDICAAPRVLPVVEAMAALTLADFLLRMRS